jgi:hypothetical protein
VLEFQTVEERVYSADATNRLTPRQQRLLLRAVVGTLVLSAALAQPAAAQQGARPRENAELVSVRVNPQPFRDLLAEARRLTAAGRLDPAADYFTFTVEAARNADGTLGGARVTEGAAVNPRWRALTGEFVRLLSDSRALAYLEGVERVTLTVSLGDGFSAELAADTPDAAAATRHATVSGLLFGLAHQSQQGRPGVEVFNNMTVSSSGKRLLLKLDMTRAEVGNLLSTSRAIP